MSRVKTAVVGVGALGEHHARIHSQLEGAELVALVDTRQDRAERFAARYGCRWLQDHRDLPEAVEAVSLAAPTAEHASIGAELLRRGVHVLVEKPMAADLAGADLLMEAARDSGCVLHVGHSERFNPAVLAVRSLIKTPRFFEAHRLGVFVPRSLDIDVVLDLMIHDLDLILDWVGRRPTEIRAVGIPVLTSQVDIANARLEFPDGCVANVTASRVSSEKVRKLRFFQQHDYVSIDFQERDLKMFSLLEEEGKRRIVRREFEIEKTEPLRNEIEVFLKAVRGESEAQYQACTGQQGRRALEVALAVLAEMQRKR